MADLNWFLADWHAQAQVCSALFNSKQPFPSCPTRFTAVSRLHKRFHDSNFCKQPEPDSLNNMRESVQHLEVWVLSYLSKRWCLRAVLVSLSGASLHDDVVLLTSFRVSGGRWQQQQLFKTSRLRQNDGLGVQPQSQLTHKVWELEEWGGSMQIITPR